MKSIRSDFIGKLQEKWQKNIELSRIIFYLSQFEFILWLDQDFGY